jgi:outer membrane receptor protein involved in Fe transport
MISRITRNAACALLALALSAHAQVPAEGAPAAPESEDEIHIIGHYNNGVGTSDAASQGYVTPKLIEARPMLRPGEVLEYVPGVIITQHSGEGKANQYFLRGFNLDHGTDFRTSVAGIPVNMPTHAHGQGYSDLNFLIPELVSRIDYMKGPYFAEVGDFASAGAASIEYYTSMPKNIAEASVGSFGYRRALIAGTPAGTLRPRAEDSGSDHRWLYALELYHNDGPWQNPSDYKKLNGVLRYSRGTNADGITLSAMAYTGKWNSTDQIPQRAVDAGLVSRNGALDTSDGGDTSRYSLSFDRHKAIEGGTFHFDAYAIRYKLSLFSNFTFFKDSTANGDQFQQLDDRSVFGVEPKWVINHKLAGMNSVSKFGLQLRRDSIGKVGLYSAAARQQLSTVREDRVQQTGAGAFYENTLQWTEWLKTVAGVRSDFYRANVQSNLAANSGQGSGHVASPKLNFIFGPWAKTEYFLNFGEGFHSNDARGTTISVDPKTGAAATRVTPLVKTRGSEVGVRSELVSNLQSSLSLWRMKIDSELLFVGDAGSTEASRPSRRQGAEWSNRYTPKPWLIVDADVSASKAEFSDDNPAGNRIPGSIDKVASLGVTVNDLGRWSASAHLRYFGPRPLIEDNSRRSQSTIITSLRGGYKFDEKMRVNFDLYNLFNRRANDIDYFYCSRLRSDPAGSTCRDGSAGVDDIHFHPVEPRSLRVSMILNY